MRPEGEGPGGERGAHTFSSLPIPSLLQPEPCLDDQTLSHSWPPPPGRSMDGSPVPAELTWVPGQKLTARPAQGPSLHVQASACPPRPLWAQLPCRCYSWKLPQKHCTPNRCWRPGPCPLPPPQDTPAVGPPPGKRLHCLARPGGSSHISHHQIPERGAKDGKDSGKGEEEPQGQVRLKRQEVRTWDRKQAESRDRCQPGSGNRENLRVGGWGQGLRRVHDEGRGF